MRNPRRAYDAVGNMLKPATVAGELANGHHLAELWCNACVRHVEIPIDDMPSELAIPDIALGRYCSKCGSRNITSRMSITEKYEIADCRRGT